MAVTLTAHRIGRHTFRITMTSTLPSPTFRVFRSGVLVAETQSDSIDVYARGAETIEVLDDPDALPAFGLPDHMVLTWFSAPATAYYRIDEFDGTWSEVGRVFDQGQAYFRYDTEPLADVTEHQFRVVPVGTNGIEGTAQTFSALMVRKPDGPAGVNWSYDDGTGTVTIG